MISALSGSRGPSFFRAEVQLGAQEKEGEEESEEFCAGLGEPEAVDAQPQRQEQDAGREEEEGACEGDDGRDHAVAQGCEEGGGKDIRADEQEAEGVEREALRRQAVHRAARGQEDAQHRHLEQQRAQVGQQ